MNFQSLRNIHNKLIIKMSEEWLKEQHKKYVENTENRIETTINRLEIIIINQIIFN
jgi:hypothetical protein